MKAVVCRKARPGLSDGILVPASVFALLCGDIAWERVLPPICPLLYSAVSRREQVLTFYTDTFPRLPMNRARVASDCAIEESQRPVRTHSYCLVHDTVARTGRGQVTQTGSESIGLNLN
jgi:hypothetical protein